MSHTAAAAPYDPDTVARVIAQRRHLDGPLMPVLHGVQDELGWVPPEAVGQIAQALDLSRAEVHGVLTYYHHFRTAPPARVTIQMCRAEACRSMGCEALAAHAEARTGCRFDAGHGDAASAHARADVALESVYCLGLCAQSPSMTVNGVLHAKVTPEKFDALLADAVAHTREAA